MDNIKIVEAYNNKSEIKELLKEYTVEIIGKNESVKRVLQAQDFDYEINNLEKKYYTPNGKIFLIYYDGELAGCMAFTKIGEEACEMKRLFLRPDFRDKKLGYYMINHLIKQAKESHYKYMYLDSISGVMDRAIALYERIGFEYTDKYNESPIKETIYMRLDLK